MGNQLLNQKFTVLEALGIILVVAGHSGNAFFWWFPPYSFHMPLFMFISGYFFRMQPFSVFFSKKFKRLIVPFLLWNVFYGILITVFSAYNMTQLSHASLSFRSLLWDPFTSSWPFVFNGPAWFVGALFFVQLMYWTICKISRQNTFLAGGGISTFIWDCNVDGIQGIKSCLL